MKKVFQTKAGKVVAWVFLFLIFMPIMYIVFYFLLVLALPYILLSNTTGIHLIER